LKSPPNTSTDFGLISNIPDQLFGWPPNAYSTGKDDKKTLQGLVSTKYVSKGRCLGL